MELLSNLNNTKITSSIDEINNKLNETIETKIFIEDMSNKSRDSIAINLIDVDKPVDQSSVDALSQIDHVLVVRSINH